MTTDTPDLAALIERATTFLQATHKFDGAKFNEMGDLIVLLRDAAEDEHKKRLVAERGSRRWKGYARYASAKMYATLREMGILMRDVRTAEQDRDAARAALAQVCEALQREVRLCISCKGTGQHYVGSASYGPCVVCEPSRAALDTLKGDTNGVSVPE